MDVTDVIVIGAGPAGLYAAEHLAAQGRRVCVLEAAERVGGRAYNERFEGVDVETGAGVGRWPQDERLAEWLRRHGEPVKRLPAHLRYWTPTDGLIPAPMDVSQEVRALPRPTEHERRTLPFGAWLRAKAGSAYTRLFIFASTYNDYLKADIVDTLDHYHFEDVAPRTSVFLPHWTRFFAGVVDALTAQGVILRCGEPAERVARDGGRYTVTTPRGTYSAARVVLAIPARPAERLLRRSGYTLAAERLQQIRAQPFVRAYVRFAGPKNYLETHAGNELVCPDPFRKIIPVNPGRRVYMIAYCDNAGTRFWKRLLRDPPLRALRTVQHALESLFDTSIQLAALRIYYHKEGTHYFPPLPAPYTSRTEFLHDVAHIDRAFTMVGEAVALDPGWTNSALATVARYLF